MTDAYVIEIDEDAVGLVVRETRGSGRGQGYRFYASLKGFQSLEGKIFSNPESARRSARVVSRQRLGSGSALNDRSCSLDGQRNPAPFAEIKSIDLPAAC